MGHFVPKVEKVSDVHRSSIERYGERHNTNDATPNEAGTQVLGTPVPQRQQQRNDGGKNALVLARLFATPCLDTTATDTDGDDVAYVSDEEVFTFSMTANGAFDAVVGV